MVAALVASVIGGVAAILLSLPLRSPDDVFFNTLTVAIGALLTGGAGAIAWRAVGGHLVRFEAAMGGLLVLAAAGAFAGEAAFTGMLGFALPLAAVVLGSVAAFTPLLARRGLPMPTLAAIVPMLALGFVLAGRGDAEVQALSLPTAASASTPAAAATSSAPGGTPVPGATRAAATDTATAAAGGNGTGTASTFRTPSDVRGVVFTVGQGSEAQFTVREKLAQLPLPNDATMHNKGLTGEVRLDGPSTVKIDLQQLTSDQSRRDNFIRRQFSREPIATVTIDTIGALPAQYAAGEVVKRQVTGRLRIMGNEAPIAFDVEARLESDVLSILGRTTFRWADYKIPPPNVAGTVQVEDEVNVTVLLVAKATR